jgi:hypothetical protein
MKFDTDALVNSNKLEKLKSEYFATDWKSMPFAEQEKKRDALFTKFGMSADEFYDGELAKYDTENTKKIKQMKTDAFNKTKALFDEYGKQPVGTRSVWAANKLRELVDSGYFASNPFLKGFDWQTPSTISSAYKKMAYDEAQATGKWTQYNAKYGTASSQKSLDYSEAKRTGNWSDYTAKYGSKYAISDQSKFWAAYAIEIDPVKRRQLLRDNPQYAKTPPKSEAQIAASMFWAQYAAADKADRRDLMKDNPQFNTRGSWTDAMWDKWRTDQTAEIKCKAGTLPGFTSLLNANLQMNAKFAAPVLTKKQLSKRKKLVFVTS